LYFSRKPVTGKSKARRCDANTPAANHPLLRNRDGEAAGAGNSGGAQQAVTKPGAGEIAHVLPQFLPGGNKVLDYDPRLADIAQAGFHFAIEAAFH